MTLRHYEEYSNSSHGGLNSGLKRSGIGVRPTHSLLQSTKRQLDQNDRRMEEIMAKVQGELLDTPKWTKTATSKTLVKVAEGEVQNQRDLSNELKVIQVSPTAWRVTIPSLPKSNGIVPQFRRVRQVSMVTDVECSRGYFDRMGLPCHHQIAVLRSEAELHDSTTLPLGYIEPTDCSIVWWKEFCALAGMSTQSGHVTGAGANLLRAFESLKENDILGPRIPEDLANTIAMKDKRTYPKETEVPVEFRVTPAVTRVNNYDPATVQSVFDRHVSDNRSTAMASLTQESWVGNENRHLEPVQQLLDGVNADGNEDGVACGGGRREVPVFCQLKPYIQEIAGVLESCPDPEYLLELKGLLADEAIRVKVRAKENIAKRKPFAKHGKVYSNNGSDRFEPLCPVGWAKKQKVKHSKNC